MVTVKSSGVVSAALSGLGVILPKLKSSSVLPSPEAEKFSSMGAMFSSIRAFHTAPKVAQPSAFSSRAMKWA